MKLGDGVEAAIHCTTTLAGLRPDAVISGADLATGYGLSASYLLKHLKALTQAGILASVPGPKGGYRIGRPADQITLLDIVLAVEGPEPAFRCAEIRRRGPGAPPPDAYPNPCGINAAMLRAERAYRAALGEVRVADLLAEYEASSDPRVLRHGCAMIEQFQRLQPNAAN